MQSTPNPSLNDPHDVLEITPDVVLVARAEEELSKLARDVKMRPPSSHMGADSSAGPSVPPVDTTFRSAVNDLRRRSGRPSFGRRALRGLAAFLFAVGSAFAAVAWQSHGEAWLAYADAAKQTIGRLTPLAVSSPPTDTAVAQASTAEDSNSPAVQASAPAAAASQPVGAAQTAAPVSAATSTDQAQLLQSMARDVANVGQEIDQLKAGIAELKANQGQMSRDIKSSEVKPSEPIQRPKLSAVAPRPVAAPVRRPAPTYRPPPATTAYVPPPPSAAPYVPPQPQAAAPYPPAQPPAQSQYDPDAPRPPMPVR